MKNAITRAVLALALPGALLTGCHTRGLGPLSSAPACRVKAGSQEGTLGRKVDGQISDEEAQYCASYRYEIPPACSSDSEKCVSTGALIIAAKPAMQTPFDVEVFTEGNFAAPLATTNGQSDKKLVVPDVKSGIMYYVVVREDWDKAIKTRFALSAVFKPANPDQKAVAPIQDKARPMPDHPVTESVDYSGMKRTTYWKVSMATAGGLTVKFSPLDGANISADVITPDNPKGDHLEGDSTWKKDDLPAGDYFVKVYAIDAGDAGSYLLSTNVKMGDTCKAGGESCTIEGAEELKPSDSKQGEVDFTKLKQFHFYKLPLKDKGKLTLAFKVLTPKGSKVAAYLMRNKDDEGERISGTSVTKDITDSGEVFIRVQAPEAGDFGKYAVQTIFTPSNVITGEIVEIGKGCELTVGAGTTQGVRSGAACTIVNASGAPIDSCTVTDTYPNLSKVRGGANCKNVPRQGGKVQINAQ